MPLSNKIVFASAGAGKTTEILTQALSMRPQKVAIATFTLKNVEEIARKIIELNGCLPPEITIYPWYTLSFTRWCARTKVMFIEKGLLAFTSRKAQPAHVSQKLMSPDTIVIVKTKRIPIVLATLLCCAMRQAMEE
jgi:hypothetical protein